MRFAPIFAAMLAFSGVAVATPAAAETALTRSVAVGAPAAVQPITDTAANQYRGRGWRGDRGWRGGRGWRGNRGWGGWRGDRGWHRGYYRRGYYRPYRWNRGRVVCRYRYGYRRCFRTY